MTGVAESRSPRRAVVLLTGLGAVGSMVLAIAVTYRLNMWDIRAGWPITLWRVAMFGSLLSLGLVIVTTLLRRRWLAMLATGSIALVCVLTLVLMIGTTSNSMAGFVFTMPAVLVSLLLSMGCATLFFRETNRFRHR